MISGGPRQPGFAGLVLAGICATLVGVGLQRFAYAPLLPAMVRDGWLPPGDAGTLGAINFAGYLAGAAMAPSAARAIGVRRALQAAMALACLCFALCAWRGSLLWFAPWRAIAGIVGGWLMVLGGPAVQAAMAPAERAMAGSALFAGVGLGIVISAVIVPSLLPFGLPATWLALAAITLVLGVLAFPRWPEVAAPARIKLPPLRGPTGRLVAAYTLSGVAATPYMGWWPDFIARGLGRGTETGALYWLLFGGAIIGGAVLSSRLAARLGTARLFHALLVQQVLALALPLLWRSTPALVIATLLAGCSMVSLTAMALTRSFELAAAGGAGVWRINTVGWAGAQTVTAFGLAALYTATGSHLPLFAVGLAAALAAAVLARS